MKSSRVNNQTGNKSGVFTALIFLFVNVTFAQTSFPINDPRNPDCPCHKYQKLADDEFKKLLALNNVVNKEVNIANDDKKIVNPQHVDPFANHFEGISEDEQGKTNKQDKANEDQKFGGISSDDLARINISQGDNVLGKINEDPGELIVSEQKMGRSGSSSFGSRSNTTKHWKGKRKKHSARYKQIKRIFCVSGWDIWKRKRVTSACYHWK